MASGLLTVRAPLAACLLFTSATAYGQGPSTTPVEDETSANGGSPDSEVQGTAKVGATVWMVVQTTEGQIWAGSLVSMTPAELTLKVGLDIVRIDTTTIQRMSSGSLDGATQSKPAGSGSDLGADLETGPSAPPSHDSMMVQPAGPKPLRLQLVTDRGEPIPTTSLADFRNTLYVVETTGRQARLSIPTFVEAMERPWLTRRWMDAMRRESVRKRIGLAIVTSGAGVLVGGLSSVLVSAIAGVDEPEAIVASAALSWSSLPAFALGAVVHMEGQIRFRQMQQSEINLLVSPSEADALVTSHNNASASP